MPNEKQANDDGSGSPLCYLFWATFIPIGATCLALSCLAWPIVSLAGEDSFVSEMLHQCIWYPAEYWEDFCLKSNTRYWVPLSELGR